MNPQSVLYKAIFQIPVFTLVFYAVLKLVDLQSSGLLKPDDYRYLMIGFITTFLGSFVSPLILKKWAPSNK